MNMNINMTGYIHCLQKVRENFKHYVKHQDHRNEDFFRVEIFTQMWGNTSGGFQGIGGSAMTDIPTVVLIPFNKDMDEPCQVWFNGKYAYSVELTDEFREEIKNKNVKGLNDYKK